MLKYILQTYSNARFNKSFYDTLDSYVTKDVLNKLSDMAYLDQSRYLLKGSGGMKGNWEIPWIGIFDKDITINASMGFYIVYLFRADMSGLYISLNQGYNYYLKKYGQELAREKAKEMADYCRIMLESPLDDFTPDIELRSRYNNGLTKGYEATHICGKFYSAYDIPDNHVLINDLRNLLGVYRELKGYMGFRTYEEWVNYILIDKPREVASFQ